jgi:heme exporter protein D
MTMDTLLLGITVVSLVVALVMSVTAWRLIRDEKRRSAARIAALSAAAGDETARMDFPELPITGPAVPRAAARTPWKPAPFDSLEMDSAKSADSTHATGFLGASQAGHSDGNRQRGLAIATVVFFLAITGALVWTMSGPEGTSAVAVGPNAPLELVSLSHARQKDKLAVSGLVRNPAAGQPVEKLSAVVFLFDRMGTFVTSSRAHVDFLKLGAGDESPFVVSIEAPETVARYRVSFRTDDGVVPHIDRRGDSPAAAEGEQPVNVTLK